MIQAIGKENAPEVIEVGEQNGTFWSGEDYHQKYRLRRNKALVKLAEQEFGLKFDVVEDDIFSIFQSPESLIQAIGKENAPEVIEVGEQMVLFGLAKTTIKSIGKQKTHLQSKKFDSIGKGR